MAAARYNRQNVMRLYNMTSRAMALIIYVVVSVYLYFVGKPFFGSARPRCRSSVTEKMTNNRKGKFMRTRRENPRRCATRLLRRIILRTACETIRKISQSLNGRVVYLRRDVRFDSRTMLCY